MDNLRAHVVIEGHVQGVFFRASTRDEAVALGVRGFVRNNPDGTVEALFEGAGAGVRAMLKWCESGPSGAHVANLDIDYEDFKGEFSDFRVLTGPGII